MYGNRTNAGDSGINLNQYQKVEGYDDPYGGYSNGAPEYPAASARAPKSKGNKKWLWIVLGAIIAICIIVAAVVGGVLGSRAASDNNTSSSSADSNSNNADAGGATPTGTDSNGNPVYPTSTGSAQIAAPTLTSNSSLSCEDPYQFSDSGSLEVRAEHPLLFAPAYKWSCMPDLVAASSYMTAWNETIFNNASRFYDMEPTNYSIDGGYGGSGVLDVAREVQLRIKHWGYAYKMSNNTRWVDRTWQELLVASGNSSQFFGDDKPDDRWNSEHFLDTAEFTAAFGIAYDWLYDAWTDEQRTAIMWSIINLGLSKGLDAYASLDVGWWRNEAGNWNCVCNGGMTLGALAIANEDPTGTAAQILAASVPNAIDQCENAVGADGTWTETPNYWYFGTTGHTQMAAALISATGNPQGLMTTNPQFNLTGLYHMYVTGQTRMFNYGDTGPNKYTATANGMMFYGKFFDIPEYILFQRDRSDAPEPMSMLYYDPQVEGDFWYNLALDHYFDEIFDAWVSMRGSWTNTNALYVAMKASQLTGHQTHGDLDVGDFVLDALGQRWAGELGSGNYLADGYFSSEDQDSERWWYYRKRTEGQNTLTQNYGNQLVDGTPSNTYGSTGEAQDELNYTPATTSTAFFVTDMTSFYNSTNVQRGIRLLNGRRQVLLRDEIDVSGNFMWRMNTNATVEMGANNQTATLSLGGETLEVQLRSPADATFTVLPPTPLPGAPTLDGGEYSHNMENEGVSVLAVELTTEGSQVIEVLFNPQWSDFDSFQTPPDVALADWSLTSHQA